MANHGKSANCTTSRKAASPTTEADAPELSSESVEKIMSAIEALGTKMDTQTAALRQEIVSIH